MKVCWFSCGVSSCVAAALEPSARLVRIAISDEHSDNERFCAEVEPALGRKIETLRSPWRSVDAVARGMRYINGTAGAPCTRLLKRTVREEWERANPGTHEYVWGFDADEAGRMARLKGPHTHTAPLIDRHISKAEAHGLFARLFRGIKRPVMYELGYQNNNCIGCVKGGMGYWNAIRRDFPLVFKARAALERELGASCISGVYLDELDPNAGKHETIATQCGLACFAAMHEHKEHEEE